VLQTEHGDLAGEFARAWSPRPEPFESLVRVARRHDDGWFVWERGPCLDPDGRPANFLDVPVPLHLAFYKAAIVAVTAEDPYAGLILSLHGAGIYKRRYGLQDDLRMRFVDDAAPQAQAFVEEQEASIPGRLAELEITEDEAWHGYKLLQVWDRFSLYACLSDLETGVAAEIPAAPVNGQEVTLQLRPVAPRRVSVSPYPFARSPLELQFERRFVPKETWQSDDAFREAFFAATTEEATISLESA
jgi:hypothetical protein